VEYLLGVLVVVAVVAFVVLPLLRGRRADGETQVSPDPASERAAIYRELMELELDQKVGKIADADYREINDALLARAAALISQEDADTAAADAQVEREIAEARKALRQTDSTPAECLASESAPAGETRS
jgi:cytochrome c-type biogenesis protein CcmI